MTSGNLEGGRIHLSLTSIGFVIKALPSEDDDEERGKEKREKSRRMSVREVDWSNYYWILFIVVTC